MGRKAALAAALIPLVLLVGCGRRDKIVVGSKNFTEQLILGEIVAQHLEKELGKPVERRLNLGGTLLAQAALIDGKIDVYPEYTGTALISILKEKPPDSPGEVLRKVREGYRKWNIEWLDPLGFNNTFAMVVKSDLARTEGLKKLSDAGKRKWLLGIGYEFASRADGLPGLQQAYSLPLARSPFTMDLGLLYQALESGQVEMAAANSTDAQLATDQFAVLEDDRHFFPPYEGALAARAEILNEPVRKALSGLSGRFTDTSMRKLNYEVTIRKRAVAEVAREFLSAR